ncbi:MAG: sigma-70 family RNA polymerase sigma factor [Armatimonadota bacterium]
MQNDMALLERYSRTGDAEAFAELAKRYVRLVYSTCLRITANTQEAEDITQDCFLELARRAGTVRSCLPGWLHKVAKNRALNAVSKDTVRRRYEQAAVNANDNRSEPGWAEIVPIVDEALDKLPDKLREPIVLHYFQGLTQAETAAILGINQSTISRYLDRAIDSLREELKKSGVVLTVGALTVLLTESAKASVPASVAAAIGKIAVSGIGTTTLSGGFFATAKAALGTGLGKAALALSILAASLVVGHMIYANGTTSPASSEVASTSGEVVKRDSSVLQIYLLPDTTHGTWRVTAPKQAGEGYIFERVINGTTEAIDSAKQPKEIMDKIVNPQQNPPVITTNDLLPNAEAQIRKGDGKPTLNAEFTERGAQVFADFTGKHIGECTGVFANGRLISAPVILQAMHITRFEITGFGSLAEAEALAKQINGDNKGQP